MSLLLPSAQFRAAVVRSVVIVALAYMGIQKLSQLLVVEPAPVASVSKDPKLVQVSLDWQPSCQAPINLISPPSPSDCQRPVAPAKPRQSDLEASIPLTFRK